VCYNVKRHLPTQACRSLWQRGSLLPICREPERTSWIQETGDRMCNWTRCTSQASLTRTSRLWSWSSASCRTTQLHSPCHLRVPGKARGHQPQDEGGWEGAWHGREAGSEQSGDLHSPQGYRAGLGRQMLHPTRVPLPSWSGLLYYDTLAGCKAGPWSLWRGPASQFKFMVFIEPK